MKPYFAHESAYADEPVQISEGTRKGWMSRPGHRLGAPDAAGIMACPESAWRCHEVEPGVLDQPISSHP